MSKCFRPLFAVEDSATTPFGTLDGGGTVMLARKTLPTHTSWFCSLPPNDDVLLGQVFKESGAHLYLPPGDVIHAGGGVVCVHSLDGGPRQLKLRGGKTVTVSLPPRSTTLYDAETGAVLIA